MSIQSYIFLAINANFANYAQISGECVIFFDYCGDCKLSNLINSVIPNVKNIDCSDFDKLQGMGYMKYHQMKQIHLYVIEMLKCKRTN